MNNPEVTMHQYNPTRIIEARKNKGLSQEKLAFASGLSLRTIQRIEKGNVQPRLYSLSALAEALGCSLDHFKQPQEVAATPKASGINWMILSVYSVVILPFLPLLLQAVLWYRATALTEEEDHQYRKLLHFQGQWLAGLVLILLALPITTKLLTGQVRNGDFPLALLIYLLFVVGNLVSTLLPVEKVPHQNTMT
ncbi:MAG: helix-turn-helix domain-containing protein [Lewinella sp.]